MEPLRKYHVITYGCQMNVHDSEKMSGLLEEEGYVETGSPNNADVIVFNTCSIREKAEQKFFSMLGRVAALKKKNPRLRIGVAGCVAQQQGAQVLRRAPYVDFVIGPQNIHLIGTALRNENVTLALRDNPDESTLELPALRRDRVRAWINIMYGCDNFCSYCVVPYTRGRERSRAAEDILAEVRALSARGFREVTLLGQNVNSYRSSLTFPGLLRAVASTEGIRRVRFVTSHPKDLSEELMAVMGEFPTVCKHIHLPLQSGSDTLLALMNRKYTYEYYRDRILRLRETVPGIAITSDIIAGFPQESDADHQATVEALGEMGFDGIFAFKFSARPFTAASKLPGHLPDDVKSRRLTEILNLQNGITEEKNRLLEGSIQEVLVEGEGGKDASQLTGRTDSNKVVNIRRINGIVAGDMIRVRVVRGLRHSLEAEPVP